MDAPVATPIPDEDLIDRFVALSTTLFRNHGKQIAQFAPPIAGFTLFLLYFHAHHFYPSFDLLQFSSLLLGAGMIGFAIIGSLLLWMLIPGLWIFHGFIEKEAIRQRIRDWFPEEESKRGRYAIGMMLLCFVGPYLLCSLLMSTVLLFAPSLYVVSLGCTSLLLVVMFGIAIQAVFKLPTYSFLRYAFHAWVPVWVVTAMAFLLVVDTQSFIEHLDSKHLKILALYLIPLGGCLFAAISAMGCFGGLKYAIHFSLLFALLIAFYNGALAGLPDRTMRSLGLGNYQAESVLLEAAFCADATSRALPLAEGCSLKQVQVVWSMGDTLTLMLGNDKAARQVQIPNRFVKAIVRNPG